MNKPVERPIRAIVLADGVLRFQYRNPGAEVTYECLTYDEYIARWDREHPQTNLPRCADPRCNEPFESNRADQIYCSSACNSRHRMRMNYRAENGLSVNEPAVDKPTKDSKLRRQMLEALNLAKLQHETHPQPTPRPELIPGTNVARMRSATQRDQDERARLTKDYNRFEWDLRKRGYDPHRDFTPQRYTDLMHAWTAVGEQLPDDAQIDEYVDFVQRQYRLAALKYAESKRLADEAQAQATYAAQCPVTMDEAAKKENER